MKIRLMTSTIDGVPPYTMGEALRFDYDGNGEVTFACIFYGYTNVYLLDASLVEAVR